VLWKKVIGGSAQASNYTNCDVEFILDAGRLFVSPSNANVVCLSTQTGDTLWNKEFDYSETLFLGRALPPITGDALLFANLGNSIAGLDPDTGKILWSRLHYTVPRPEPDDAYSIAASANGILYGYDRNEPVINGIRRSCRTGDFNDIVAYDAKTGIEKWRWQNGIFDDGDYPHILCAEGDTLYAGGNDAVVSLRHGAEPGLPVSETERRSLAAECVQSLSDRYHNDNYIPGGLFLDYSGHVGNHHTSLARIRSTLLQLGDSAAQAALEIVRTEITRVSKPQNDLFSLSERDPSATLISALDLLYDMRAYSAVPQLATWLKTGANKDIRLNIAEALIRLNRPEGMDALFEFATSRKDDEAEAGEESLYYLCRNAPKAASPQQPVSQNRLTEFLIGQYSAKAAPRWVRIFAQFELFNHRGEASRQLAKSGIAVGDKAQLMPTMSDLIASSGRSREGEPFRPAATATDGAGVTWGIFDSDYLGDSDVWVVQSRDGKKWTRPTLGIRDVYLNSDVDLEWGRDPATRSTFLAIAGQSAEIYRTHISISNIYHDTDGDRTPDSLKSFVRENMEPVTGSARLHVDTNNKNPTFVPHTLSRDERMYAAVLEAISTFSVLANANSAGEKEHFPRPIVNPHGVLIAPRGPAGRAVPVKSFPNTVIMYNIAGESQGYRHPRGGLAFCAPLVGLDGRIDADRAQHTAYWDDFQRPIDHKFKSWFPFMVSPDGKRVRVGVDVQGWTAYDVEVDEVNGEWLPVECRCVWQSGMHWSRTTAAPESDTPGMPVPAN
jgi:hypothetical protein